MSQLLITGTGLFTPEQWVTNEELVASFNEYVRRYNERHADAIAAGEVAPLETSSEAFIENASGIRSRYVLDKSGIVDPEIMHPVLPERAEDEQSIQCEISVTAAREALARADKGPQDIDAVLIACSNMQRPYPAISVEVQDALGIDGFAFDMNVACSSATFGLQTAADMVDRGHARAVLVVSPEICSGHLNFRDRDSHFIFGDACTAVVVESAATARASRPFEILGTRLKTQFSNNIRNNFGFLNRCEASGLSEERLFHQNGRKVFKEVVPMVESLMLDHLADLGIPPTELKRLWLHQANSNMNELIARRVLGRPATEKEAPTTLDTYANTSSAGSIIAFHTYHEDLEPGDIGAICSFGAGYSAGNVVVKRIAL